MRSRDVFEHRARAPWPRDQHRRSSSGFQHSTPALLTRSVAVRLVERCRCVPRPIRGGGGLGVDAVHGFRSSAFGGLTSPVATCPDPSGVELPGDVATIVQESTESRSPVKLYSPDAVRPESRPMSKQKNFAKRTHLKVSVQTARAADFSPRERDASWVAPNAVWLGSRIRRSAPRRSPTCSPRVRDTFGELQVGQVVLPAMPRHSPALPNRQVNAPRSNDLPFYESPPKCHAPERSSGRSNVARDGAATAGAIRGRRSIRSGQFLQAISCSVSLFSKA